MIDWTSSDESIASVDHGLVVVNGKGEVDFGVKTANGLEKTVTKDIDNSLSGIVDVVIGGETQTGDVYDLTGRCILTDATPEQIRQLSRGVYIVGGKKIFVR